MHARLPSRSGSIRSSESWKASRAPRACSTPVWRARATPPLRVRRTTRTSGWVARTVAVSSVDASSTTMISKLGQACWARTDRSISGSRRARLNVGMTTEIAGAATSETIPAASLANYVGPVQGRGSLHVAEGPETLALFLVERGGDRRGHARGRDAQPDDPQTLRDVGRDHGSQAVAAGLHAPERDE